MPGAATGGAVARDAPWPPPPADYPGTWAGTPASPGATPPGPYPPPPGAFPPAFPTTAYPPPAGAPSGYPGAPLVPSGEQGGRWGGWDAPPPPPAGRFAAPGWWRPPTARTRNGGPPTYLWQSILVTFLFFWPTGIVAIYFSSQVNRRLATGDMPGAVRSSRLARTFCLLSLVIGIVALAILVSLARRS